MTETVEQLKRNSRTIRQSRMGLYDEFGKFAVAAGLIFAALLNASIYLQIVGGAVIVVWCAISIPRWRRVRAYRIEDHCSGVNAKEAE